MSQFKFKVGDKVRVTKALQSGFWYASKIGEVFTIKDTWFFNPCEFNKYSVKEYEDAYLNECDIELVKTCEVEANKGFVVNEQGGVKGDGDKVRPTILLKDLNESVQSVIRVLEYGAKKYSRANYAKVETERYEDALGRHYIGIS